MVKNDEFQLDLDSMPKHIAFIMDGNGRWAKEKNMPRTYGHKEGTKTIREIALEANKLGIKAMTIYAFSTENFSRPEKEVNFIFKLPKEFFDLYLKELIENNVKISTIGNLHLAPKATQDIINSAIDRTSRNSGLNLCFAFIYGGRDELVNVAKEIAKDVKLGNLEIDQIDHDIFENKLMTKDLPQIDLMVRTSGEQRLSNFLLWQLAYSEFVFTETKWPDFSKEELRKTIFEYQNRNRRFGGL